MSNSLEEMRTKCEVYSRVVGYITPVSRWNDAKKAEYDQRATFEVAEAC